ncbi:MAG: glycosyltransferase family 9 protein, partial [Candidatus Hydrogenedentales bacterium]
ESVGVGRDETGNRPLREAARWLRGADLVVCLDSGLMHLALALGTPVLALYGPTDPSLYVRDHPLFHVVDNGRSCRACWNRGRMTQPGACPLHIAHCLDTIAPAEVLRGVEALIPRQVNRCASSF